MTWCRPAGRPMTPPLDVLVFYVPVADTDRVLDAVLATGAGAVGDYRDCAFVAAGTGQFRPVARGPARHRQGRRPREGRRAPGRARPRPGVASAVVAALREAHPYEEPAFHILETADLGPT